MIKPNSVLRRKWFQITSATVGAILVTGGAVGGGVAAGIIKVATQRAKDVVSDLGITPDTDTKSDIDNGKFKTTDSKLNVVALGDSVTAGYTTLSYGNVNSGSSGTDDVDSYADYLAYQLNKANKLGTYDNLAKDGLTSSGLLDSVTDLNNLNIISKSNLVVLTIGANDILRAVKFLGIPFSQLKNIIGNPMGTTSSVNAGTAATKNYEDLNPTVGANALYLPTLLANIQKLLKGSTADLNANPSALDDNFKALFSVDGKVLDTELVNAASNILKALTFIHKASPGAKIIINEYQFPFNRYEHNGQNITEIKQPELASLTFNGKAIGKDTLRGVYDYVMDTLKDKTTSNFSVVEWNSLQDNQDALIQSLVEQNKTDKSVGFATEEEAIAAFQHDITDIHPTQYSHALIGQYIFNNLLSSKINVPASNETYTALRDQIVAASIPQASIPMQALLNLALSNNGANDANSQFASLLVDSMLKEMVDVAKVAKVEDLNFTDRATLALLATGSPSFSMLQALFPLLSPAVTQAQQSAFFAAVDKFIQSSIFGADSALYDSFTKNAAAMASADIDPASSASFGKLLGNVVAEAALALPSPLASGVTLATALGAFGAAAVALPDADKRELERTMNIPGSSLDSNDSAQLNAYDWLQKTIPVFSDTQINGVTSTAARTALTSLVNGFKQFLQLNSVYYSAAGKINGLAASEKAQLTAATGAPASAFDDQYSTTLALLGFFKINGLPPDASGFSALAANPKAILTELVTQLNKAVTYANALATAYPAAFFTNYATNQKTRTLTFADLARATPTASNPLGHIAIAIN